MSEKKNETEIKQKNDPQNELEGIDVDFLVKVDKLNGKFFETLDNLKEARPTFQGIDEAFLSVSENLLNAYQLVYRLLYEQYRGDIERLIAFFEAKNDRIIPFRWKRWWQRRFRQNQAMDLVDREADYEAMSAFAVKEHELYEKYLKASDDEQSDDNEDFEIIGGLGEDPAEEAESAPQGAEQAETGEEGAPAESPTEAEESPQNAPQGAEQAEGGEIPAPAEPSAEEPKKKRGKRKKDKKGEEGNECKSDSA